MKWALIFGASGDIGSKVAEDLADAGWSLYLHYYQNREKIDEISQKLFKKHPKQDFITLQYDDGCGQYFQNLRFNFRKAECGCFFGRDDLLWPFFRVIARQFGYDDYDAAQNPA